MAAILPFCSHHVSARTTTSPVKLVESKLNGDTVLSAPAPKLISAVQDSVRENPLRASQIVRVVLGSGRADSDAIAPQVAASAITALGSNPPPLAVSDIVFFTVKATPAVVLETVKASVKASPASVKTIVRAAVRAIPNPTEKIKPIAEKLDDTGSGYSKDEKDGPDADNQQNDPLPIGEAIARAAQSADPSQSLQELMTVVNQAQQPPGGDPGSYPGYYYPTALPGFTPGASPTPVPMPSPPVASR
ncbi:MAG: hypothetical protein WCD79_03900 [Chthoniobacteraceae bacterium]